jgi:2-phospho-L-lactate guanylyltransferase
LDRSLWAVLPVKSLQAAKQRLAGVLSAGERQELFRAMLEDVLSALAASRRLAGILMVTGDAAARGLGERYGARVLAAEDRGHTAASSLGARALAAEGMDGMVQVPADVPLVTPVDIEALLDAHGLAPAVTLNPSRDQRGSNTVACSPPDLLPLRFGDDSFFPHLRCARDLGIEPQIVKRPGLALDIDTPDDLATFLAAFSDTRAYAYLAASGIAERLTRRSREPRSRPKRDGSQPGFDPAVGGCCDGHDGRTARWRCRPE